jgi:hypothetical protein
MELLGYVVLRKVLRAFIRMRAGQVGASQTSPSLSLFLIRLAVMPSASWERVPFIQRSTPRAPTKTKYAEAS